jgi:hypothetical protein
MLDVYSEGLNGGDANGGQRGRQEEQIKDIIIIIRFHQSLW